MKCRCGCKRELPAGHESKFFSPECRAKFSKIREEANKVHGKVFKYLGVKHVVPLSDPPKLPGQINDGWLNQMDVG